MKIYWNNLTIWCNCDWFYCMLDFVQSKTEGSQSLHLLRIFFSKLTAIIWTRHHKMIQQTHLISPILRILSEGQFSTKKCFLFLCCFERCKLIRIPARLHNPDMKRIPSMFSRLTMIFHQIVEIQRRAISSATANYKFNIISLSASSRHKPLR